MKYPTCTRIKKMKKLAVSDMKDAITLRVLEQMCSHGSVIERWKANSEDAQED